MPLIYFQGKKKNLWGNVVNRKEIADESQCKEEPPDAKQHYI